MVASLVMSGEQSKIPKTLQQFSVAAKDSFEVALNMACAAVLDGQLPEARRLLQLAETKALEVLTEEDVSQMVNSLYSTRGSHCCMCVAVSRCARVSFRIGLVMASIEFLRYTSRRGDSTCVQRYNPARISDRR